MGGVATLGVGKQILGQRQTVEAVTLQCFDVEAVKCGIEKRLVAFEQLGFVETHGPREASPQFGVRNALPQRLDRFVVPTEIQMTPCGHHVQLFDLSARREDHVGVTSSVGDELLGDHREEILALETTANECGVRSRDQRIAVVDEQGRNWWRQGVIGEVASDLVHAQRTTVRVRLERFHIEDRVVDVHVVVRAHAAAVATAAMAPRPDQGGQTRDGAEEHGSVLAMLGTDEGADHHGLDCSVLTSERLDVGGVDATHFGGAMRIPFAHVGGQLVEALRVSAHVVAIDQSVPDENVHHGQHQRHVGSGQWLDEPVGGFGGDGAHGIDDHNFGAVGPCLFDERPQVPIREARVGSPQKNQLAESDVHRIRTQR